MLPSQLLQTDSLAIEGGAASGKHWQQNKYQRISFLLQSGDYFFQSLTINSGALVRATPKTRLFVNNQLILNSAILASAGTALQPVFLGFAGTTLNLFAAFNGTLLAPNAFVTFGTGSGLIFTGAFYARTIEVTPASQLVCLAAAFAP